MHTTTPTKQTLELVGALRALGVEVETEYYDGHKRVDICVPKARLYIEVDGMRHYTDPKQILADFRRDHFSDGDDFSTMRLPNELVDEHLQEIANAIAQVVYVKK